MEADSRLIENRLCARNVLQTSALIVALLHVVQLSIDKALIAKEAACEAHSFRLSTDKVHERWSMGGYYL